MKATFETTGGLAGLTIKKTVDTDKITEDQASELRKLVDASNFFNLPSTTPYRGPMRDFFHYELTIESEGKSRTINVDEPAAPPELKPLLRWLRNFKP